MNCWCGVEHAADHLAGPTWYEGSPSLSLLLGVVPAEQVERDGLGHTWIPWMREHCAMFWLCVTCRAWRYAHICGAPDPVGGPMYYSPGTNPSWDEPEDEPFRCGKKAGI